MMQTCKQFTAGIYQSLNNLIQHLNQPDIQSVEALCIRFVGDSNGGRMLFRLLYWFPKSVKKTGEVYKSWRDWDAELCLTRSQVVRVHRERYLEAVGVLRRQRQTTKGNPVHYLLDVNVFLAKLAEFADVNVDTVLVWMADKPSTEKPENPCAENQQAYTTKLPTKKNTYNSTNTNNNNTNASNNNDVVVNSTKLFSIPGMKTPVLIELGGFCIFPRKCLVEII